MTVVTLVTMTQASVHVLRGAREPNVFVAAAAAAARPSQMLRAAAVAAPSQAAVTLTLILPFRYDFPMNQKECLILHVAVHVLSNESGGMLDLACWYAHILQCIKRSARSCMFVCAHPAFTCCVAAPIMQNPRGKKKLKKRIERMLKEPETDENLKKLKGWKKKIEALPVKFCDYKHIHAAMHNRLNGRS